MVRKTNKKMSMSMTKKQNGGFLPMLLGALAPALIQGVAGALGGKGMKKMGKKK